MMKETNCELTTVSLNNVLIVTARARSTTERYCFHRHLSVCPQLGMHLSPRSFPYSLVPGHFKRGYPSPRSFRWSLVLTRGGEGVPHRELGYPPPLAGTGVPPPPRRQNSRASTCYVVGGTPLAVTQEDCLV